MRKIILFSAGILLPAVFFAQGFFVKPQIQKRAKTPSSQMTTESMDGSIVSTNNYLAGTTMNLTFSIDMTTPDFEYGDSLAMTFPGAITVNSASDSVGIPTEGQATEYLNLPIASPLVTWGDNVNAYGGIEPSPQSFSVSVTIPAGTTGPIDISWHLDGDEYGAAPNFLTGTTQVNPLPTAPDLNLVASSDNKYHSIPVDMPRDIQFSAELVNNGSDLTTPVDAEVNIAAASYSEASPVSVPLAPYANQSVSWSNPVSLTTVGSYDVYFDVPNAGDFNPSDNKDTMSINITDSTYAYMDTITGGTMFYISATNEGILGNVYDILVTSDLTSISYYSPNPDPTAMVSMVVYEVDANGPTMVKVFETDTFPTEGTGSTIFTKGIGITLTGGERYLIGVREQVTGGMNVGVRTDAYYPNSQYAFFQGVWQELSTAGFNIGFAINANFGESCSADFTYEIDVNDYSTVDFTAASVYNGTGTLTSNYDFGDAAGTANTENPSYTYSAEGNYDVCLTINDGASCTNTKCKTVIIDDGINSVSEIPAHLLEVYPNPTNGIITVNYDKEAELSVYGIDGSLIKVIANHSGSSTVDLSALSKGTYLLKITSVEGTSIKRVSLMK
jgi:PKD repeat protein